MYNNKLKAEHKSKLKILIKNMLVVSQSRGKRATGIALTNGNESRVLKDNSSATEFVETDTYSDFMDEYLSIGKVIQRENTISILGHCRLDTQGSPVNYDNNHPIITKNIVGVHNGHIHNDDSLFRQFLSKESRIAEVDSEIIFQLIDHFYDHSSSSFKLSDAIIKASKHLRGSYACAFMDRRTPDLLYVFRNMNPLSIRHYHEAGMIIVSTLDTFIEKSMGVFTEMDEYEEIECPQDSGIVFNLFSKTMKPFTLEEPAHDKRCMRYY
jgi:glucosamine 6-phosphate synthetase-like amidotransferase/phosphosugar isomerase protein